MPERKTMQRARRDKAQGKAPSTQAGEFVREEVEHVRRGKHGARSSKQAIAIGLSKARRAGVKLPPKKGRKAPAKATKPPSKTRSRATKKALAHEPHAAGSHRAMSRQARGAAKKRSAASRSAAAKKAARTREARQERAAA